MSPTRMTTLAGLDVSSTRMSNLAGLRWSGIIFFFFFFFFSKQVFFSLCNDLSILISRQ